MENLIRGVLKEIGENPDREGLLKTPHRVAKAYEFLCAGYKQDAGEIIKAAIFEEENHEEMIVVRDIELYSLCEHHMLPFFGKAHVAYLPKRRILGLSKVARVVEVFARRLQVQERLTTQIASTLQEHLDPWGVGVVVEAQHLCMQMRGIQKQNSCALTSSMLGVFRTDQATREEFLNLIFHRRS